MPAAPPACCTRWAAAGLAQPMPRFLLVSTSEVYGDGAGRGPFVESDPVGPTQSLCGQQGGGGNRRPAGGGRRPGFRW